MELLENSQPQDLESSLLEEDPDELEQQVNRVAYEQTLLNRQRAGEKFAVENCSTAVGASGEKDARYAIDLDGIAHDLFNLHHVNFVKHERSHVDWRLVFMKRFNTNWITPGQKQLAHYTWPQLAGPLKVPHEWLRVHCNKRLKIASENNGGFKYDLQLEEINPPKGSLIIPWALQELFVDQHLLQM